MKAPLTWDYSALLTPAEGVTECSLLESGDARPTDSPIMLTEAHLQVLWLEQTAFSQLHSAQHNLPIEVIHPGIWNQGPGPDFLHAHIRIGDTSYHGAVELHLSDSGWVQHGHNADGRYEEVILHVSYESPSHEKPLLTLQGRQLERVYLAPFLRAPLQTFLRAIDLDLYPLPSHTKPGMCAGALFDTLSQEEACAFFDSAARWRLQQKRLFLTHFSPDPAMQCAVGMAMALGYKHNARAMARLFLNLWPKRHLDQERLFAEALASCHFFNDHYQTLWGKSAYYQMLHQLWQKQGTRIEEPLTIVTAQQRPAHHPVRRLAALICLLQDPAILTFWDKFQTLWHTLYEQYLLKTGRFCNPLTHFKQALIDFLPDYKQLYWSTHYTFETTPRPLNLALLGEERREILLINVFFPLLWYALIAKGDVRQQETFLQLYAAWKGPLSQKQRYVTHRFFSQTPPTDMLSSAMLQQGAFQLHSDFCTHYEASCVGCPFVERARCQVRKN